MENRRPPHAKSSGGYFDRNRSSSFRGASGGDGRGRGKPRTSGPNDGRDRDPSRSGRGPNQQSRFGGPKTNSGKAFGDHGHFNNKNRGNRDRDRNHGPKRVRSDSDIKIVSDAQITDGKFRGKTLFNSVSPNSTPTCRKLREAAFRILARRIKAGRILDLGAGPGTIGVEALSRGAMLVTFVDRSARMCSFIRKNLAEFGIKDGHGEVVEMEILPFLVKTARRRRTWDIIYVDIPAGDGHTNVVEYLGRGTTIKPPGLLVIQHNSSASYPERIGTLKRWRTVDQPETILSIYERI